jgi:hypothetical protein
MSTKNKTSLFNVGTLFAIIMAITHTHFWATFDIPLVGFVNNIEYWQGTSVGRSVFVGDVLIGFVLLVIFVAELRKPATVPRKLAVICTLIAALMLEVYWIYVAIL